MCALSALTEPYTALEAWAYDRYIAPAVESLASELEDALPALPDGAEVLDVGCGGGHNVLRLADRRPGVRVTGLDLSDEQIARARQRAAGRDRVSFVVGSALDIPFPDGRFDAVLSVASLKHWPDPARGVAECVRVLKPGGLLFIAEADRGCRLEDARAFVSRWRVARPLLPIALAFFRTWVAGRSLSRDEARATLDPLPVTDASVDGLPGTPAFVMRARAAGAS